ncbi:lyso-ornithine lipid acyltransferase [Puniceibacterium sediminis]|uniref:Lyso-ornithine lipid acyltransferase n=2 Tax=Puniceibacterium sediminis TaxID=1608407 RepID=A0A238XRX9_9RHOB|nr:lysophospholipid acyltransferase family protein [Puniceibacterium sediminis]SNR61470.1 lyso-ornithine lipid acyltransferase [Puniceibacterium sediminis]
MPPARHLGVMDWLRVLLRGSVLGGVTFGGLLILVVARLIERPLCGVDRPVTPYITQGVCRAAFIILQLPITARGPRIVGPGAVVANHSSWIDIFALNSRKNVYFVSKSEVAGWPGIGWLARATGTVFIRRDPKEAASQAKLFEERLLHRHRLLFFPEGTSTDGLRVLPFKSTLFAAFFADGLKHELKIQPVSVIYHAPEGEDPRFYGWWGDMSFGEHLVKTLAARRQGRVELIYHAPVRVDAFPNRKSLASHVEAQVRIGHGLADAHQA